SRPFSTSAPASIRVRHLATKATIPNRTAMLPDGVEYAQQSLIDPTPKTCLPSFQKMLHKGRAGIEQAVGKLKRFKRVALRCEKTAQNYGSLVALACAFILIKSVHGA